jgi:molybdate transport system regulatory protein
MWIDEGQDMFLGNGRVRLLRAIAEHGSISAAAKSMGMSYKKAWDQVDAMNKQAEEPLVQTSTGGKKGGGTHLTSKGQDWVERFEALRGRMENWVNNNTEVNEA